MTTKQIISKLCDCCDDIMRILHFMQVEAMELEESADVKNKTTPRVAFSNLCKIEERITIEKMRFRKMNEEENAEE